MRPRHHHAHRYAGLRRRQRRGVYAILLGIWLSGVLWLLVHYALRRPGAFGVMTPSPLEPWCLALHGAFAFITLGLAGWLLAAHLPPAWRSGHSRRSGVGMATLLVFLTVSGYLLYYVVGDAARSTIALLHWAVGLALPLMLGLHLLARRRARLPRSVRGHRPGLS